MLIDPQQEFFTALKIALEAMGYDVYDGVLPPENTPYPFIYLGDFQQVDSATKNAIYGTVYATIHVWHNIVRQRGTVSKMMYDVKYACRMIDHTANFAWDVRDMTGDIITDTTTKTPLMHGVVQAGVAFS